LFIGVILKKKSDKRPSKIDSRKTKNPPICKRKKNLSDEGAIVLFEEYNLLDDGSFLFFSFLLKKRPFPKGHPPFLRVIVPKN
jgi:hypothetical protein